MNTATLAARRIMMTEYRWRTINISPDTYDQLRSWRKPGESMDVALRRILKLPSLPIRSSTRKRYYPEDEKE